MSVAKQFEKNVETQIRNCGYFIYRLYDTQGFYGVYNICDYVAYKKPVLALLELKTTEAASLPLANISDGQYNGLLNAERYDGIASGFLIWWINRDITKFLFAHEVAEIAKTRKSIPHDTEYGITLKGTKKLKFWDYDWNHFFEEVENALIQQR